VAEREEEEEEEEEGEAEEGGEVEEIDRPTERMEEAQASRVP